MISPSNDLGEEEIGVAGLEEEVGEGHQERYKSSTEKLKTQSRQTLYNFFDGFLSGAREL